MDICEITPAEGSRPQVLCNLHGIYWQNVHEYNAKVTHNTAMQFSSIIRECELSSLFWN